MTGDVPDFLSRLRLALPNRWFPDATPTLNAVLTGLAAAWTSLYGFIGFVRLQSRIATATDSFLDTASEDFFGARLTRSPAEPDNAFRIRIQRALLREHATRAALRSVLTDLTGHPPAIFEPARPADTGAYGGPTLAYGICGGWGSLSLPFQVFVTARRPATPGIANVAGYGTGGPLARCDLSQAGAQVTDSDIHAAILSVLPTASTAWTSIIS